MRYAARRVINLDHNATTPLDARVRAAMVDVLSREGLGNPSSTHGLGRATRDLVEAARRAVAAAVDAEALGVTFVSGGTEADNLAIVGGARSLRARGLPCGVVTTRVEHPAVVAAAAALEADGVPVVWVPVDEDGTLSAEAVATVVREHPDVGLVSIAAANHELGNVYPVEAIAAAVKAERPEVLVHCDAVQAFGKRPVSFADWGVDLMSVSSHKIYGPAGVGALVHHTYTKLAPLSFGGSQERGRRVGTENWMAVHGFGVAASLASEAAHGHTEQLRPWRDRIAQAVLEAGGRVHGAPGLGNTINFAFEGAPGELMCMNFDLEGIALSTGAACSAGSLEPSKVILALGQPAERAAEAVRVSMGRTTTEADVQTLIERLPTIVGRVRAAHGTQEYAS